MKRKSHPIEPLYFASLIEFTFTFSEELSMPILSVEKKRLRTAQKLASRHMGRNKLRSKCFPELVCVCDVAAARGRKREEEEGESVRLRPPQISGEADTGHAPLPYVDLT